MGEGRESYKGTGGGGELIVVGWVVTFVVGSFIS